MVGSEIQMSCGALEDMAQMCIYTSEERETRRLAQRAMMDGDVSEENMALLKTVDVDVIRAACRYALEKTVGDKDKPMKEYRKLLAEKMVEYRVTKMLAQP